MKKMSKILAFGIASFAMPAMACTLEQNGERLVGSTSAEGEQFIASDIVGGYADRYMELPAFKAAGCTKESVMAWIYTNNGWKPDQLVPRTSKVRTAKLSVKPEPIAVTKEEAPVAQTAIKPLVEPSAELRKAQANLQTAKQEQSRLKDEVAAIAARSGGQKLSPEDRAKVDQLSKVNGEVKSLETRLRQYIDAENAKQDEAIATAGTDAATAKAEATDAKAIAEAARKAAEAKAQAVLPEELYWVLGALGLGLLALLILRAVDHTALRSILRTHSEGIQKANSQIEAFSDTLPWVIKLMPYWFDIVSKLSIGESAILDVCHADTNGYEPRFNITVKKISDDEVECHGGLGKQHKPSNPIKIAHLEKTVRKAGYKNLLDQPVGQLRSVAAAA